MRYRPLASSRPSNLRAASAFTLVAFCAVVSLLAIARAQSAENAAPTPAFDWEQAAGGKMAFDVASIKPDVQGSAPLSNVPRSNFPLNNQDSYYPTGGLFSATNYRVDFLIGFAYKLTSLQTSAVTAELPKWATTTQYDIQARASGNPTKDQMRLMMQALLADRFKFAAHIETRQGPISAFVLAKAGETGPELKPHANDVACANMLPPSGPGAFPIAPPSLANGLPAVCGMMETKLGPRGWHLSARNVTIPQFISYLGGPALVSLDRPAIDRTGLRGTFDVTLDFIPDKPLFMNGAPYPFADSAEVFPDALRDQLGIKLQATSGPIDTLVIDHIEQPTPN